MDTKADFIIVGGKPLSHISVIFTDENVHDKAAPPAAFWPLVSPIRRLDPQSSSSKPARTTKRQSTATHTIDSASRSSIQSSTTATCRRLTRRLKVGELPWGEAKDWADLARATSWCGRWEPGTSLTSGLLRLETRVGGLMLFWGI